MRDKQGREFKNIEGWWKYVGQTEAAARNADAVRAHAADCKIFQMAWAKGVADRHMAERATISTA